MSKRKSRTTKTPGGIPAAALNGWSFHQLPDPPWTPPPPPPEREPYIENAGNGWWTVHAGGCHGNLDVYGKDEAERCLAAVLADREKRKQNEP